MVIHVQQVPVPWKPPFSPQNIPFYPPPHPTPLFEGLSALASRRHTTRGLSHDKAYFLPRSLID